MLNKIKENKVLIILIILGIVIIAFSYKSPAKKTENTESPTPVPVSGFGNTITGSAPQNTQAANPGTGASPTPAPLFVSPPLTATGTIDINSDKVKQAIAIKKKLQSHLPIYIDGFSTSAGVKTTINIYSTSFDPNYLIHVEIYGIDYRNKDIPATDSNMVAFKESFEEAKRQLAGYGVDLNNIYFVFGQKAFIQDAAYSWIRQLNLI